MLKPLPYQPVQKSTKMSQLTHLPQAKILNKPKKYMII